MIDMNLMKRLHAMRGKMSRTQNKIASLILERGEESCFMSLHDFSKAADVAPLTVMKFCRKLGYDGYSDFRRDFQGYIQSMISPKQVIKDDLGNYKGLLDDKTVQNAIEQETALLTSTYASLNQKNLVKAVNLLCESRKIYLVGRGLSVPIEEFLLIRLDFLCLNAQILSLDNTNLLPNRLLSVDKNDVFVVFTFPNYSEILAQIASFAHSTGCKVICITDKPTAPAACYADVSLFCRTYSLVFYNSMTAVLSLVNLLAALIAIRCNKSLEKLKPRLREIKESLDRNL